MARRSRATASTERPRCGIKVRPADIRALDSCRGIESKKGISTVAPPAAPSFATNIIPNLNKSHVTLCRPGCASLACGLLKAVAPPARPRPQPGQGSRLPAPSTASTSSPSSTSSDTGCTLRYERAAAVRSLIRWLQPVVAPAGPHGRTVALLLRTPATTPTLFPCRKKSKTSKISISRT